VLLLLFFLHLVGGFWPAVVDLAVSTHTTRRPLDIADIAGGNLHAFRMKRNPHNFPFKWKKEKSRAHQCTY
jgi:hypothetical protein